MKKKNPWSRGDKLTAAGVAVAVLAIVVSLLFPEVRRKLGLEKPAPALVTLKPAQVARPEPPPAPTPKEETITRSKTKKRTTSRSQPTYSVTNPTGSIVNQNSANYGTQTITNNFGPKPVPDRTLSSISLRELRIALTVLNRPVVDIAQVGTDTDIPAFPDQIKSAFRDAGWRVNEITVNTYIGGSREVSGLHCGGDVNNTEVKQVLDAFKDAGIPCAVDGLAQPNAGELFAVVVGPKPKNN